MVMVRGVFSAQRKYQPLTCVPRHGYPVIFIQRRMLLQALYQNLKHKDRVLVQKRLVQIQPMEDGVRAIAEDGSTYTGHILIGADGMHSSVRKQMHTLGNNSSPGHFDQDEYSSMYPASQEPTVGSCVYR